MKSISRKSMDVLMGVIIFISAVGGISLGEAGEEKIGPLADLTHTVFAEELTGTWCIYCPAAAEQLNNVYLSGDYPFYFVALIEDKVQKANDRCTDDYNVGGYPTVHFDGGYESVVGAQYDESEYRVAIESCGTRTVPNIGVEVEAYDIGPGKLEIYVSITNMESTEYTGYLRTYISEIVSRYMNYDGEPYHFGFLDYAFDEPITVPSGSYWTDTVVWDGSTVVDLDGNNFGNINPDNIMINAVVFSDDPVPKLQPDVFFAYYVDEAVACLVTPPPVYGVDVGPSTQSKVTSAGETIWFSFTVTNTGNVEDTFSLELSGAWSIWGTLNVDQITVPFGDSDNFYLEVTVPLGTDNGNYEIYITVTSQGDPNKEITVETITIVDNPPFYEVLLTAPLLIHEAHPGDSFVFSITVHNEGNTIDTIDVEKYGAYRDWGTLSHVTVTIDSQNSKDITLTIDVPPDAIEGDYTIDIRGTSQGDPSKWSEITFTTHVIPKVYDVILECDLPSANSRPGEVISYTITVLNNGNVEDTVDLVIMGPFSSWGTLSTSSIILDSGTSQDITLTVDVPPDANGGEYIISVRGTSNGDQSIFHDVDTTTTVEPWIYEVHLSSDNTEKSVRPGNSLVFNITVENRGDNDDTIDLFLSGESNLWGTLSSESVFLGPSDSITITLTFEVPPDANGGYYNNTVSGTSRGNLSRSHEILFTMDVIPFIYGVELTSDTTELTVRPGQAAVYNVMVKNTGNNDDVITLELLGSQSDWGDLSPTSVSLPPGESEEITLGVDVPSSAPGGDYIIAVRGTCSGNTSIFCGLDTITTVEPWVFGVVLSSDEIQKSTRPGRSEIFNVTVKNEGETHDTIELTISGENNAWAEISEESLDLGPSDSQTITVTVNVPDDAVGGDAILNVRGTSSGDPSKYNDISLTTTVVPYVYEVILSSDVLSKGCRPGDTISFDILVKNEGDNQDTFNLTLAGEMSHWADIDVDSIHLMPGKSHNITLTVIVPWEASGGDYGYILTGQSMEDEGKNDELSFIVTIEPWVYGIGITPYESSKTTLPDNIIVYFVEVENIGELEDTFHFSLSGDHQSWCEINPQSLILPSGSTGNLSLTMEIPADAQEGEFETLLRANSGQDPTVRMDIGFITDVIPFLYDLDLNPEYQRVDIPQGQSMDFTLTVENLGNTIETIAFTVSGTKVHWTSIEWERIILDTKEVKENILTVYVPSDAQAGSYVLTIKSTVEELSDKSDSVKIKITVSESEDSSIPQEIEIINIHHDPLFPSEEQIITVYADVQGEDIRGVYLELYQDSIKIDSIKMQSFDEGRYTTTIGPLEPGTYDYMIIVEDGDDNFITSETMSILVNEIIMDEDDDGVPDDLDAFPEDPTQWTDLDKDGYGDNPGGNNPDMYPLDASRWKNEESQDSYPDWLAWIILLVIISAMIVVVLVIIIRTKSRSNQAP